MLEDLVRRWQAGRSISREWNSVDEDGVITLEIGDPERMVSYVATDPQLRQAAALARKDHHPPGLSWLSIVTTDPDTTLRKIESEGLEYSRAEWLMSVSLAQQPVRRAPGLELIHQGEVVSARVMLGTTLAARGQMVVMGNDAIVDMVWTEPEYRRRGLAGVVMSTLAGEALASGATTGLLAASPEGRLLYHSLGWTTTAYILVARTTAQAPPAVQPRRTRGSMRL